MDYDPHDIYGSTGGTDRIGSCLGRRPSKVTEDYLSRVGAGDAYLGEGSASLACGNDGRDAQIREGNRIHPGGGQELVDSTLGGPAWAVGAGGGQVSDFAMILELKDGRIWRDRRYYAEPFEAPEWRAQWVERVEF